MITEGNDSYHNQDSTEGSDRVGLIVCFLAVIICYIVIVVVVTKVL
ncbi:MAG: hypothetical protein ACJ718_11290 [Nitrososphaeraceae archaeon]